MSKAPLSHHRLWFVAHRPADGTYRSGCYVCGYWSDATDAHDEAHADLVEHLRSERHTSQYRVLR